MDNAENCKDQHKQCQHVPRTALCWQCLLLSSAMLMVPPDGSQTTTQGPHHQSLITQHLPNTAASHNAQPNNQAHTLYKAPITTLCQQTSVCMTTRPAAHSRGQKHEGVDEV